MIIETITMYKPSQAWGTLMHCVLLVALFLSYTQFFKNGIQANMIYMYIVC